MGFREVEVGGKVETKSYTRQYAALWAELSPVLEQVIREDKPILGKAVARFEAALASVHGVAHAVGVGSGTDALILSLRALGVGEGDEVITGAHTFAGVVSAILQAGASPVLVEPDAYGLLGVAGAEAAITPRTRCILPVHFHGHPVDATGLRALADARGLVLLEDVAQAHGATWQGRPVGSFGHAAAMSFHPSKNLGAFGDGGAVLTDDGALAARLRILRNLGKDGKYDFAEVAPNSKLDTLQAALLEVKLRHLPAWVERRRALARRYLAGLEGVGDLELPRVHPDAEHAWHLFVVRTGRREALRAWLAGRGIRTSLHYPTPAHRHPAFAERLGAPSLPRAERLAERVLTLPLSHEHTDAEIDRVIEGVRDFFREA